jgi:hypothetical protein
MLLCYPALTLPENGAYLVYEIPRLKVSEP